MLVSIIIPCFNSENYITDCLDSCLAQSYQEIEIICIDDGSTDGTLNLLNEYAKSYPKLLVHSQKNAGACAARNKGIAKSKGEFIQFLDADDELLPYKIEFDVELLKLNEASNIVIGSFIKIELNGRSTSTVYSDTLIDVWKHLIEGDLGITSSNFFRAKLFRDEKICWHEELKSSQEYNLMFDILKLNSNVTLSQHIHTRVIRRDQTSIGSKNQLSNLIRWIELRTNIVDHLKHFESETYKRIKPQIDQFLFEKIRLLAKSNFEIANKFRIQLFSANFHPKPKTLKSVIYSIVYRVFGFKSAEKLSKIF